MRRSTKPHHDLSTATRLLLAVTTAALALVLPAGAQAATQAFGFTGGPQAWTVPAGVTSASFDLSGAQGGSGGKGARVVATIAVTPGSTLLIYVGGQPAGSGGGFNGGGSGGAGARPTCGEGPSGSPTGCSCASRTHEPAPAHSQPAAGLRLQRRQPKILKIAPTRVDPRRLGDAAGHAAAGRPRRRRLHPHDQRSQHDRQLDHHDDDGAGQGAVEDPTVISCERTHR